MTTPTDADRILVLTRTLAEMKVEADEAHQAFEMAMDRIRSYERTLADERAKSDHLRDRLDHALAAADAMLADERKRVGEGIALLTELIDGPSRGEFYGIDRALRNKLRTVRASLSKPPSDGA